MKFRKYKAQSKVNLVKLCLVFAFVLTVTSVGVYAAVVFGFVVSWGIQTGDFGVFTLYPEPSEQQKADMAEFEKTFREISRRQGIDPDNDLLFKPPPKLVSPLEVMSDARLMTGIWLLTAGWLIAASYWKARKWRLGGKAVARRLNARRIYPGARDPAEERAINVLEEVSLAAGISPPPLYLLDYERAINALAAGRGFDDGMVALTEGAARLLNRDELQAVIAHEFSHLMNGDSHLRIQLSSLLYGVECIGLFGRFLSEAPEGDDGPRRHYGRSRSLVLTGLALRAVGWAGLMLGRFTRSCILREQEYLADAVSVEYTRNPLALAGVFKKVAALPEGSYSDRAAFFEFSPFFFAPVEESLSDADDSHPSLDQRMSRVDPSFEEAIQPESYEDMEAHYCARLPEAEEFVYRFVTTKGQKVAYQTSLVGSEAKRLSSRGDDHFPETLPKSLVEMAHEPYGAKAVLLSFLVSREPRERDEQLEIIRRSSDVWTGRKLRRVLEVQRGVSDEIKLTLCEMLSPILEKLSPDEHQDFDNLIRRVAVFCPEWRSAFAKELLSVLGVPEAEN